MAKCDAHIVPGEAGWREVVAYGRARSVHRTQTDAREAAGEIAGRTTKGLDVHGCDGHLRERTTYGKVLANA